MVVTEQYFPRGGTKPKETFNERKKFDFLGNADRIGKKRKYRAPKIIPEPEDDDHISDASDDSDEGIKAVSAEAISPETLQEGMVILGRVMNIFDTKVIVSLPGRLTGVLMACHISTAYSKLLKAFVNDEIEDLKRLPDILKVGEYVSVKVLSVAKQGKRNIVTLSLMPQDVNKGIYFNTLKEGMLLTGAIDSVEDHGFVIDLGIPNSRAFLPSKYADKNLNTEVGQVVWCVVKKCQITSTNTIVTISNSLDNIQSTCIAGDSVQNYQVTDLRPGMALQFHVNKPLADGAEGSVLANSTGYIHVSQIGAKVHVGKTLKARLLYVMPITKLAFFTTRKIFDTLMPDLHEEADVKVGRIVEAQVTKVTPKAVIFRFNKSIGIMKLIQSGLNTTTKDSYPVGSQHTVRIIKYHPSDYAYICSDKEELLEQKYFNLADLAVGEIVEAVVENIADKGVTVRLGNIKGWIPELHVSDVALFHSNKSSDKVTSSLASKKFKIGQTISARVLKLDLSISALHLTAKPMLLDPELRILSKYEDAKVGFQYKGVVVRHFQFGVLVAFFGEVKAMVQQNQLSHQHIDDIPAAFLIGQIVNCTILSVNIAESKIRGSFIKPGLIVEDSPQKKSKKSKKRQNSEEEDDSKVTKPKKNKTNKDDVAEVPKKKQEQISETIPAPTESEPTGKKNKNKKNKQNIELQSKKRQNSEEEDDSKVTKSEKNKTDKGDATEVPKKKQKKQDEISETIPAPTESEPTEKKNKNKKNKQNIELQSESMIVNEVSGEEENAKKKKNKTEVVGKIEQIQVDKNINSKKQKKQKLIDTQPSQPVDIKSSNKSRKVTKSDKDIKTEVVEPQFSSIGNFWELNASTISKNISKGADDASSSDSEAEKVDEKVKKKKKRLTVAEKVDKVRLEEEKMREVEQQLSAADSQPSSSDQFDRLLMANPNSSELWIAYMAFHLQATEIEKARSVGRKALKTISFREEQDKLNVWLAMLNIENRFGTKESLTLALQEALQLNNPFDVHSKMLDMYLDTGKVEDVQALVDTMVAKYRNNPQTYILAGEVLYKLKLVDKARSVMQKAVSRLENKTHIPVLIKFANMENHHGDSERAESLFEQIVGVMPQRVDIWCVYVDMLLKSKKVDSLRLVFERAVSQKLTVRKMKTLYKKWVEIEEKLGNSEQVDRIRQMAMEYINKVKC